MPDSCTARSPCGGRCGELRVSGNAPGTASVANSLPHPERIPVLPGERTDDRIHCRPSAARPVKPVYVSKLVRFIEAIGSAGAPPDYPVVIEPLPPEDGGGYQATVPDLPGCVSDGATRESTKRNVGDAIEAWIEEAHALGRPIPSSQHVVAAQA